MGMDLHGNNPITEEGEYFRNNIWSWGPLADYIEQVAPDLARKCRSWSVNEGDGLDAADALELAARLQAEIDSGRCERYARTYARTYEDRANGTLSGVCDVIDEFFEGTTYRPFNVQNVRNFVTFLRGCGGFQIW
jgi:hypothetical protein